jgi:cell wall-associated NlpC family hydrolase
MLTPTRSRDGRLAGRLRPRAWRHGVVLVILLCALAATLLGVFLVCFSPGSAEAAPTTTTSIRLYGTAKSQVDSLTGQAGTVQAEIDSLDDELELATENYNQLSVKLDQINVRMADLRRQLGAAQTDRVRRVQMLEERIVGVYKSGGRDQLLQMLLLADGVDDLFNRIRVISTLADQDNKLVDTLRESTDSLDSLLKEIDVHKREELSIRHEMDNQRGQIEAKLVERQSMLASLDTQIGQVIETERVRQEKEQAALRQSLLGLLNGGQQYAGPLPQNNNAVLDQFVQTAATYMGIPYVWAGDRPSTGFDCSGFTQYIFAQHGISLPHYSGYQAQMGIPVDLKDIQAGDLLAFGFPVHHVGIYIGDGLFIHAPRTGDVVKISPLAERTNLAAIRRFPLQFRVGAPVVR